MAENGGAPAPAVPYMCRDLVYEILLRLPPADVHRNCRNVCTEWRKHVAEGHLIVTHRQLRSPMPLFFYRRDFSLGPVIPGENPGLARVDLQAVDLAARESRRVLRFADVPDPMGMADADDLVNALGFDELDPNADTDDLGDALGFDEAIDVVDPEAMLFVVEGSCDGLLLLSYLDRLYVCNPCSRHWARLPPIHLNEGIVAFYARGPPGDGRKYRVLYQTGALLNRTYCIRVLGAPEQHAVTTIGRRTSPAMPQALALALDGALFEGLPSTTVAPPIMVHGSLHWLPMYTWRDLYDYKMVAFDTAMEEFRWISSPPALTDPESKIETDFLVINAIQLLEIEGMLAMAIIDDRPGTMIHVWVLHDYVNEAWVQRYKIDLLAPAITANNDYDPIRNPPLYVVSEALYVMVPCPYVLLQCDSSGAVLQHHRRPHHWTIGTGHLFEESFVRPAFLSAQGNDIEPRFFLFQ